MPTDRTTRACEPCGVLGRVVTRELDRDSRFETALGHLEILSRRGEDVCRGLLLCPACSAHYSFTASKWDFDEGGQHLLGTVRLTPDEIAARRAEHQLPVLDLAPMRAALENDLDGSNEHWAGEAAYALAHDALAAGRYVDVDGPLLRHAAPRVRLEALWQLGDHVRHRAPADGFPLATLEQLTRDPVDDVRSAAVHTLVAYWHRTATMPALFPWPADGADWRAALEELRRIRSEQRQVPDLTAAHEGLRAMCSSLPELRELGAHMFCVGATHAALDRELLPDFARRHLEHPEPHVREAAVAALEVFVIRGDRPSDLDSLLRAAFAHGPPLPLARLLAPLIEKDLVSPDFVAAQVERLLPSPAKWPSDVGIELRGLMYPWRSDPVTKPTALQRMLVTRFAARLAEHDLFHADLFVTHARWGTDLTAAREGLARIAEGQSPGLYWHKAAMALVVESVRQRDWSTVLAWLGHAHPKLRAEAALGIEIGLHQHEMTSADVPAAVVARLREMMANDSDAWARGNAKSVLSRWPAGS